MILSKRSIFTKNKCFWDVYAKPNRNMGIPFNFYYDLPGYSAIAFAKFYQILYNVSCFQVKRLFLHKNGSHECLFRRKL